MSFPSAIAGPSRLPYRAIAVTCCRTIASARSYATAEGGAASAAGSSGYKKKSKATNTMLQQWLADEGRRFETPAEGEKAMWLGGSVPYPGNPSFKPPPPLSSELQETIYREMCAGTSTLGEISAKYNVGRARLDAIRKLKEVEAEYKRQSLPLQTKYQDEMETLLACRTFRAPMTEASIAEADEERRYIDGIGGGGAFGDKNKVEPGSERTVFEWRGEDDLLDARAAGLEATLFPTVETDKQKQRAAERVVRAKARKVVETVVPTSVPTTTWRFTDLSKVGVPQNYQVAAAMEKRSKLSAKRQQRRRRRMGIFD